MQQSDFVFASSYNTFAGRIGTINSRNLSSTTYLQAFAELLNGAINLSGGDCKSSQKIKLLIKRRRKIIMIEDQITETPIIEDPITQLDLLSAVLFSIVANCMILAIVLLILFY